MRKHILIIAVLLITVTLTGCDQLNTSGTPKETVTEEESISETIATTAEEITTVAETTEATTVPITETSEAEETTVEPLTEADIELDGVPYKDLTSRQVLDLYIKYLSDGDLRKASFLWQEDNGMYTAEGIEILALDSISVECYYDCWPPEEYGLEPGDYNQVGYIWGYEIDYTVNGYEYDFPYQENFIEMKKENGYWRILCAPTSPRTAILDL